MSQEYTRMSTPIVSRPDPRLANFLAFATEVLRGRCDVMAARQGGDCDLHRGVADPIHGRAQPQFAPSPVQARRCVIHLEAWFSCERGLEAPPNQLRVRYEEAALSRLPASRSS